MIDNPEAGGADDGGRSGSAAMWADLIPAEQLRKLTQYSPDLIMVLDLEHRVRFINRTVGGPAMTEVLGTDVFTYVPRETHAEMRACFEHVLATSSPGSYRTLFQGARDEVSEWESRVGPVIAEGQTRGFVVFGRDVTERNARARELDRFFELSGDLLCVTDQAGSFRRVSRSFSTVLEHPAEALIGQAFLSFVSPEDRARTESEFGRLSRGNSAAHLETRFRHRDGSHRLLSWTLHSDTEGRLIFCAARDVTFERNLERQIREAQKMEAVGQLAGGLAHDFNNLMMAVLANVEFATEESRDKPDVCEYLAQIAEAATKAAALTKQLLSFSRRDAMRRVSVNVDNLLAGLLTLLRRLIPANIEIELVRSCSPPSVHADPNQLEQVLINLCINARDAMPNGGKLRLEFETATVDSRMRESHPWAQLGRHAVIRVSDLGVGMTKEVSERIFEPFFSTKTPGQGTGLGLSTAYAIVKQHGGLIQVRSEPHRGSTFSLYLPLADQEAREEDADVGPASTPETILVAEDEDLVRRVVVQILERAGYRVLGARNGREAVDVLREDPKRVSLALLDVVMPELSGPQAYVKLRELSPDLPVIFSSGYSDQARLAHNLPSGSILIEKPYRAEALLRNIREVLARRGSAAPRQ